MNVRRYLIGQQREAAIMAFAERHPYGVTRVEIADHMRLNIDCVQAATERLRAAGRLFVVGWAKAARWYTEGNAEEALAQHAIEHPGRHKPRPLWACSDMPVRQIVVPAHLAKPLPITGPVSVWGLAA
jgi:hypothetical protein